jgi:hypothetical protein
MSKEIEESEADTLAAELVRSFVLNPNNRNGQIEYFEGLRDRGLDILNYNPQELMGNPTIRQKLLKAFNAVKKHTSALPGSQDGGEHYVTTELEAVFRTMRRNNT